jgi:hypothetical protein
MTSSSGIRPIPKTSFSSFQSVFPTSSSISFTGVCPLGASAFLFLFPTGEPTTMSDANPRPSPECKQNEQALTAIQRAVAALFRPGDVIEVRVPKAGRNGTVSGYFSDPDRLAEELLRLNDSKFTGIYYTLNPVNPALLARADNRLIKFAQTTTVDADVSCRRWLPIDLDPVRPSGISSSNVEHEAALDLAKTIRRQLASEGWPATLLSDSGNGAHLLYPIDLSNDPESTELVKQCLRALNARFSSGVVVVDEANFNASRIMKVIVVPGFQTRQ